MLQRQKKKKKITILFLAKKIFFPNYDIRKITESDTKKIGKEFLKFGDAEIEKTEFHCPPKISQYK